MYSGLAGQVPGQLAVVAAAPSVFPPALVAQLVVLAPVVQQVLVVYSGQVAAHLAVMVAAPWLLPPALVAQLVVLLAPVVQLAVVV